MGMDEHDRQIVCFCQVDRLLQICSRPIDRILLPDLALFVGNPDDFPHQEAQPWFRRSRAQKNGRRFETVTRIQVRLDRLMQHTWKGQRRGDHPPISFAMADSTMASWVTTLSTAGFHGRCRDHPLNFAPRMVASCWVRSIALPETNFSGGFV